MTTDPIAFAEIEQAVLGNKAAAAFLVDLGHVMHLWDDLIDRDKVVSAEEVNDAMYRALVQIPRNPFFQQWSATLLPLIEQAIWSWRTANRLEDDWWGGSKNPDLDSTIAYIIRSDYYNLVIACARIVGGLEHAVEVGVRLRRMWHSEGLDGYRQALKEQYERAEKSYGMRIL